MKNRSRWRKYSLEARKFISRLEGLDPIGFK